MPETQKKLLITADDYGVYPIINNGIEQCIDADTIDCVDMLVTHYNSGKYIRKFVEKYQAKIEDGRLKLGLHLNLTCGSPAYRDDPYYIDFIGKYSVAGKTGGAGWYFKYNTPAKITSRLIILGRFYSVQVRKEIEAQGARFLDYTGRMPDHISSHAGVFQATPELYAVFAAYAMEQNLFFRNPTLIAFDSEVGDLWKNNPSQKLFPWLLNITTNGLLIVNWTKNGLKTAFQNDRANGLRSTDYFVEHFFQNPTEDSLRKILAKMNNGSYEMVVHPVLFDDKSELDDLPEGINKSRRKMGRRRQETHTLCTIKDHFGNVGLRQVLSNDYHLLPFKDSNELV